MNSNHINFGQLISNLGFKRYFQYYKKEKKVELLDEYFGVDGKKGYYCERKVETFLRNHKSLQDIVNDIYIFANNENQNIKETRLFIAERLEKMGMFIHSFSTNYSGRFISKEDYSIIIEYFKKWYGNDSCLLLKSELADKLAVSKGELIKKIIQQYSIKPTIVIGNVSYYHEKDFKFLKKEQDNLLKMLQSYISLPNIINNSDKSSFYRYIKKNNFQDKIIELPSLCRIDGNDDKNKTIKLIPKSIGKKFSIEKEELRTLKKLLNNPDPNHDPLYNFNQIMEYYGERFSNHSKRTSEYWGNFVRRKLYETNIRDFALSELISMFVKITRLLINVTNDRELFNFNSKEIKLILFNDQVPNSWQLRIFNFLREIDSEEESMRGMTFFDFNIIPNPKFKKKTLKEKTIYEVKEFIGLIDYCKNCYIHKEKAIIEAEKYLMGKDALYYSGMWLYTIIQLNNAWRHRDVIALPRFNDKKFEQINLDWLKCNNISNEDAEYITDYYRIHIYQHGKNDKERFFILSDELTIPFAYSILICEIIQRTLQPFSERIIEFENKKGLPPASTYNAFFSLFESNNDFDFQNRIINRTIISYGTHIISKLTKQNSLEVAKFYRNHSSIEITNIYIDIPQEHVNYIASQLFSIGSFGFIYNTLSLLIFGKSNDRDKSFENAFAIKNFFGSLEVIEEIANCLNILHKEQNIVKEILTNNCSDSELNEKFTYINLGLLPSKVKGIQCLVGLEKCPMGSAKCINNCPLSIPSIFVLSSLDSKLQITMKEFISLYPHTKLKGEKTRLANQLTMQLDLLRQAIHKFGRDRVDRFINGGLQGINEQLNKLPSFKDCITVKSELIEGNK